MCDDYTFWLFHFSFRVVLSLTLLPVPGPLEGRLHPTHEHHQALGQHREVRGPPHLVFHATSFKEWGGPPEAGTVALFEDRGDLGLKRDIFSYLLSFHRRYMSPGLSLGQEQTLSQWLLHHTPEQWALFYWDNHIWKIVSFSSPTHIFFRASLSAYFSTQGLNWWIIRRKGWEKILICT